MQTGAIFNSLKFGGVDSADYGIYITGEAVYNAPVRAVEVVNVPGRNGAVAMDQGYWENIEVTYPAGVFGDAETNFSKAIRDFRNAIVSQVGYQRLTDTYNPGEYREALYTDGLEVENIVAKQAGDFELTFNCKPQRWLKSGEEPITAVSSGVTIPNPTQYGASPLLAVEGYGNISFNGYTIALENAVMGTVTLLNSGKVEDGYPVSFDTNLYNSGDIITVPDLVIDWQIKTRTGNRFISCTPTDTGSGTTTATKTSNTLYTMRTVLSGSSFASNTPTTISNTCSCAISVNSSGTRSATVTSTYEVTIDGTNGTISVEYSQTESDVSYANTGIRPVYYGDITVDSTVPILGHPTYIDCDLGECYRIENGSAVSLNGFIDLGSDLPELAPGENTLTFDNTVTSVSLTPRWWIL